MSQTNQKVKQTNKQHCTLLGQQQQTVAIKRSHINVVLVLTSPPQSQLGRERRYLSWQRMLSPELLTLVWK